MNWTNCKSQMPVNDKWVMTCMLIAGKPKYQRPAKWNGDAWFGVDERPLIHRPNSWRPIERWTEENS
mgnify:FL=1